MAPERRLIPQDDNVQTSTTSRIQCTSNVVGVIPPKIHQVLSAQNNDTSSGQVVRGRIDDHSSGISFLLGSIIHGGNDADGNEVDCSTISVWEHCTQTLNEELVAPSGLCVKLTHPEHYSADNINNDLLVTCLGPNNNNNNSSNNMTPGRMYGRDQARALRHVYAASPTTGVLSVWVLDTTSITDDDAPLECNASVRLKLKEGELLTALTPIDESGGDAWLLASTSLGRLWKIYKTSRPLTLHAKLVKRRMVLPQRDDGKGEEGEEETGYVRGLYNYLTTPSKNLSVKDVDMEEGTGVMEEEDVVCLIPVPSTNDPMPMTPGSGDKSPRSPSGKSPPPRKQQRIEALESAISSARVLSLSTSLVVKEWNVSLSADSSVTMSETPGRNVGTSAKKEGCTAHAALFPRDHYGTLDLSALVAAVKSNEGMQDGLVGYTQIDILGTPFLGKDGKSLLAVIRIENGTVESTRVYVVRIGLVKYNILDAAWIDCHSGQSLSKVGGSLECVGLVVADDTAEEGGGCVAYVAFGPRAGMADSGGVTISAIHFAPPGNGGGPRVKDLDLYSNVVPSAIQNSMNYDPLTGGCVLLAASGLLCGAHVRFPPSGESATTNLQEQGMTGAASSSLDTAALVLLSQDENVLTIKSHLQSAFRQYLHQLKDNSRGSNRAVVPPSVMTCTSRILSGAVVLASKDYVTSKGSFRDTSGGSAISPFSPRRASSSSPVTVLRDKLKLHTDFVTFLLHAGAYRRVSISGRILLRDHGEMITAARALLVECQSYFSKAETSVGDDNRQDELAQVRQMVNSALDGTSTNVLALPRSWTGMQQHLPSDYMGRAEKDLILVTSSSICQGIGAALRYRQNESGPLYDIPKYDSNLSASPANSSSHHPNLPSPWTSSAEMLQVLSTQLHSIQQFGESILSTSLEYDIDKANLRRYVEDISASVLSGYYDVVSHESQNDTILKSYENMKMLSIPLLRQYANSDDNDDLIALQTSVAHSFSEGIVQICHDHRQSWRFQGPYSEQDADERYDLRTMMNLGATAGGSMYAHLHRARDYRTGLSFSGFVLRWYADRGFYPEVFELGKNCPNDLSRYVRNDDRLSNLAWIQHLRVGGHEQATVGLLSIDTPILFDGDKLGGGEGGHSRMGLWEKDQLMSLAKLSNKLASAKSANPALADGQKQRNALIENSLTLISAQRILNSDEDTEPSDIVALKQEDLLSLAVEKIQSSRDVDEMKRYGICGLAIASAQAPGRYDGMANDAAAIWHAVIKADIQMWQSIADENGMAVGGGISEEELIQRVEGTAFVGVMYDFVTTSNELIDNVGFLNELVRNQVLNALLGSEDLAKVLTLSADIVVAAN